MNWIPLRVVARPVSILLLLISLFVLWRGHNEPGGGFIGGLLAASAFLVHALAFGPEAGRAWLRLSPPAVIGVGILVAGGSGLFGLAAEGSFLAGQWWFALPLVGKISSVLLFDLGVYLVVLGAGTLFLLWLLDLPTAEEEAS